MSTGLACDQIGGSAAVELLHGFRRNAGERTAEIDEPVDRQHADAPTIGEDRQPPAQERPHPPECLGGGEQLVEIEHPQQAGTTERRVVDRIRTGERAGVRLRGLRAWAWRPDLTTTTGLIRAAARAADMNLRALVIEFDVQKNRTGRAIEREEIEQVAEIDIDHVSKRDDGRKTDAVRR